MAHDHHRGYWSRKAGCTCVDVPTHKVTRSRFLRGPMPFSIPAYRRFSVQSFVTYHAGPFQGHGIVWNLSCPGWPLTGGLPIRLGKTLSLTVMFSNEQRIEIPEAVVRWSRGRVCGEASSNGASHPWPDSA